MPAATMRQLLEAGIHFGHQTRRWNPKMARYIFGQRNGIYIIDLQKTLRQLNKAYKLVRDTVADGGIVLFVGTKKQAQEAVEREAKRCGMYWVNHRWLGGTLTNFMTVQQSVRNLMHLESLETDGQIEKLGKKEAARLRREREKLDRNLKGIKKMADRPDLMFVIDAKKEAIAVREAERLKIPCIGVVDTNGDPDVIPYPVPGNDDAIRAVSLFCRVIADAAIEGQQLRSKTRADQRTQQGLAAREQRRAAAGDGAAAESEEAVAAVEEASEIEGQFSDGPESVVAEYAGVEEEVEERF